MKTIAFAFTAAIAIASLASTAGAMTLGSLSRQGPALVTAELAMADPAVCRDLTCGVERGRGANLSPVIHIVFASIGGLVGTLSNQMTAVASAD